jgi:hypothetical protein
MIAEPQVPASLSLAGSGIVEISKSIAIGCLLVPTSDGIHSSGPLAERFVKTGLLYQILRIGQLTVVQVHAVLGRADVDVAQHTAANAIRIVHANHIRSHPKAIRHKVPTDRRTN